jgi:hypothetical protein
VLRDSGSPIAGASIVIPPSVFQTPVAVTLAPGTSFVGGRDVAAGPAVAVSPDALALAAAATVYVPFTLPDGANAQDLAVFSAGPPAATLVPVTVQSDGTASAAAMSLSTFQAGIAAPPLGQPGGTYHVQTFVVSTALDLTGHDDPLGADLAGVLAGIEDQIVTFRPDHTASASPPSFNSVTRTFTRNGTAHHTDATLTPFSGSVDFAWTPGATGVFTFSLPLGQGVQATTSAVASNDGRVIAWTGRGSAFEFFAVGVKTDAATVTADLAGRWAAVELGAAFLDETAEPFRTRWHDALRSFTIDGAGAVAFDAAGQRFETEVTYHTDQADPVHTRAENVVGDGGSETWTVGINGRLTDASGGRFGWFDPIAGLLVTSIYHPTTHDVSLMIAVRQPATATPANLPGVYHFAGRDVGATAGSPTTHSSTHDITPSTGTLDFPAAGDATLSEDASSQASYLLTGAPGFTWTMSSSSTAVPAGATQFAMTLDAAGNHTKAGEERWFAFEGAGRYVLMMTRGEATRLERGVALGVR